MDAVAGTKAQVRDTRKTLPGLRALQKYAVRCGGGVNHRMSLSDAALIKDNHVAAAGSVTAAFTGRTRPRPARPGRVRHARAGASRPSTRARRRSCWTTWAPTGLREAVRLTGGRAELEASGGLTLDGARDVAETGVDYLAVGALTHSVPVLDIGLDLLGTRRAIG